MFGNVLPGSTDSKDRSDQTIFLIFFIISGFACLESEHATTNDNSKQKHLFWSHHVVTCQLQLATKRGGLKSTSDIHN